VSIAAGQLADGENAAPEAGFVLGAEGCPAEIADDLERLVGIELRSARQQSEPIEIGIRCQEDEVTLSVMGPDRSALSQRKVDLSRTASSVHARVLALAIAELIREQQARPKPRPAPKPEVKKAPRREPPPAPKPEKRLPVGRLEGFFAVSNYDLTEDLWGGGVRFWYLRLTPWHAALDFSAGTFEREVEIGAARLVSASLSARLGYTLGLADLEFRFGAGQRVGMARISGSASDSSRAASGSVVGTWTAPIVYLALDTALFGRWRAGLGTELGIVLLPVRGQIQNHDDVGVDGLWGALEIGISLGF
jgi:hypothetical protein